MLITLCMWNYQSFCTAPQGGRWKSEPLKNYNSGTFSTVHILMFHSYCIYVSLFYCIWLTTQMCRKQPVREISANRFNAGPVTAHWLGKTDLFRCNCLLYQPSDHDNNEDYVTGVLTFMQAKDRRTLACMRHSRRSLLVDWRLIKPWLFLRSNNFLMIRISHSVIRH